MRRRRAARYGDGVEIKVYWHTLEVDGPTQWWWVKSKWPSLDEAPLDRRWTPGRLRPEKRSIPGSEVPIGARGTGPAVTDGAVCPQNRRKRPLHDEPQKDRRGSLAYEPTDMVFLAAAATDSALHVLVARKSPLRES